VQTYTFFLYSFDKLKKKSLPYVMLLTSMNKLKPNCTCVTEGSKKGTLKQLTMCKFL